MHKHSFGAHAVLCSFALSGFAAPVAAVCAQKEAQDASGVHGPPLIPDVPCVACESAGAECSYVLTAYQSKRRLSDGGPSDPDSTLPGADAARSPPVSMPSSNTTRKVPAKKRPAFVKVSRLRMLFVVPASLRSGNGN